MIVYIHDVTHVRVPRSEATPDDYGQPAEGTPVETGMKALIQPQRSREQDDHRSAGAEIADHVIFVPVMDLETSDYFIDADGSKYHIVGIRRFEFGGLAHYEVDTRRVDGTTVGAEALVTDGS